MENLYQNQRSGKLLGVYKFLLTLYQELQSYHKTSQQTQRKKEIEMERRTLKDI